MTTAVLDERQVDEQARREGLADVYAMSLAERRASKAIINYDRAALLFGVDKQRLKVLVRDSRAYWAQHNRLRSTDFPLPEGPGPTWHLGTLVTEGMRLGFLDEDGWTPLERIPAGPARWR
jgi:hypothetical protein